MDNLDLKDLYNQAIDECSEELGDKAFRLNFGVYYTPRV